MRVLLTGAFGNVGESAVLSFLESEHKLRCFDLKTPQTQRVANGLSKKGEFEIMWGDIRDRDTVSEIVQGVECIIHLAAILPPLSETVPDLAWAVNVGGTRSLLEEAKATGLNPKFVYASSIATYGHNKGDGPPKTADDPQVVTDNYTKTKIECEGLVKASGLPWTILRFGVVPPLGDRWMAQKMDAMMFDIPLEQRLEFIHTRDLGLALRNVVTAPTDGKILLLGGGERCRMNYREFVSRMLDTIGIGMLPDSAFLTPVRDEDWFHTDFMDTKEAQELLHFQNHTYDDFLNELKRALGFGRFFVRLMAPLIRRRLLKLSPYYPENKQYTSNGLFYAHAPSIDLCGHV